MAQQLPIFDMVLSGAGLVGTSAWVEVASIPNGKQLLLGYATLISEDKNCTFSIRANVQGSGVGSPETTTLLDWASVATGTSVDRDFYQYGNIATITPVSTGVEKLWLYIDGNSANLGAYGYIFRMLEQ